MSVVVRMCAHTAYGVGDCTWMIEFSGVSLIHPLGDRLFSAQENAASYFFSFHSLWSLAGEVCSLDI